MPFEPGNKLSKGRPKGAVSRRVKEVEELARDLGCNPVEILLKFAKGDWEGLGYEKGYKEIMTATGEVIREEKISPGERIQAAKEVAQYIYAKKKHIEHSKSSALDGMTPQEKLEAMKHAVQAMEREINQLPGELCEPIYQTKEPEEV